MEKKKIKKISQSNKKNCIFTKSIIASPKHWMVTDE